VIVAMNVVRCVDNIRRLVARFLYVQMTKITTKQLNIFSPF